jgi:hypothetical protein
MELMSESLGIQQQYKQGFAIRQEKKEKEVPLVDITKEQWFWDMAVMS